MTEGAGSVRGENRVSPLWRKAPFVLRRYPWLLGSVVFGSLLLALTVSAYPLFISATETNLVKDALTSPLVTPFGAGIEYRIENLPIHSRKYPVGLIGQRFRASMAKEPLLGRTAEGVLGPNVSISVPGKNGTPAAVRLFAGTGARRHVQVVESNGGPGVWIAQLTAENLGVKPGDFVSLSYGGHHPVSVRVSTVYRSLFAEPRAPFWYRWQFQIYCLNPDNCPEPPPPFVIASRARVTRLLMGLGSRLATFSWEAPVRDPATFTLDKAFAVERFTGRFSAEISDPNGLGRVFHCCPPADFADGVGTSLSSSMPNVIVDAARKIAPLQEPGRVLQVAGILVALGVLAVAGWFASAGREVEERLLAARGTSPSAVMGKSCLETVVPCAIGGAAGLGLAFLLIKLVKPGGLVGSSVIHQVFPQVGMAIAASVLLLGVTSTVSYLRTGSSRRSRLGWLLRLPWELGLIGLAIYVLRRLQTGGAFVFDRSLQVKKPSVLLLSFPLLSVAGFAIAGARLFAMSLRRLRNRGGQGASTAYLAIRRLTGAPGLTVLLVSASAVCLGVFVQAQAVTRSLETTVDAKAKLFVGSDVQGRVLDVTPLPRPFALPITKVTEVQEAGTLPNGSSFDLLAVDPSTIAEAAYWNGAFSHLSMRQIASVLSRPGARAPILVAGASNVAPRSIEIQGVSVPVRTVGEASAFPGVASQHPLVVVAEGSLRRVFPGMATLLGSPKATSEFWVKGDTQEAERALGALKYPPYLILTANQVEDIPQIHAAIDTFLVMDALGLVTALLVIGGMLMYLQARHRSQVVSYGLSLRMGMTHATHRRALVSELGSMLVFAYAVGLAIALGAALFMVPNLDPLPSIPPTPLFVSPTLLLAVAFVGVIAVSWFGGWITNRRAGAVDLGEVMRLAD
jgi:hypothetical protein